MTLEQVAERVKELVAAIEQSAANHNSLIGRLNEAQHMFSEMEKFAKEVVEVVEEVV